MYTAKVNDSSYKVALKLENGKFEGNLNEAFVKGDFLKLNDYQYSLLYRGKSYNIDLIKLSKEEKKLVMRINSKKYEITLQDRYDELLIKLGMNNSAGSKVSQIKAPMPGMILNVLVNEGDEVKKGDVLLVLEAMKMENMLKSPSDGTVKKIVVQKGNAVEKNQLLIQF